jgi:hypothetical protein
MGLMELERPEVEKIIAHRPHLLDKTKKEYLIKWKNYSSKLNTWKPEENFIEQTAINDYWKDTENISAQSKPCTIREDETLDDLESESQSKSELEQNTPKQKQRKRKRAQAYGSKKK